MKSLTKENFWDDVQAKYPDAMAIFCYWIDQYKAENNWQSLFNAVYQSGSAFKSTAKYHDLPDAMQLGIFLEFLMDGDSHGTEIVLTDFDLPEFISGYLKDYQLHINNEKEALQNESN